MFSPALEKQRRALYHHAVEGALRHLSDPLSPEATRAAYAWGLAEIDRAFAGTPRQDRDAIACRAGCGHCCHVSVDVQAHEVFHAAEYIQTHFSPDALAGVIARTATRRADLAALSDSDRARFMRPCALLAEGNCTIYPARPVACRAHHTSDASVCAAHIADPDISLDAVFIPPLRARLFAVMLGLDEAFETAGLDDRAYDFGAALHEALTNSLCHTLWLRGRPAFPDSCLADAPP